ncbi:MAG: hypothetical protein IJ106_14645 [Parasporobacterium sp.]|nr:hypothetical protein [Parasporobacterium sp.]
MAIIRQYHKDTDTTYVYESISYWDAEKQQSRSKRKLLGKVDPLTGEIIPTGKRGRKKKEAAPAEQDPSALDLAARDGRIRELTLLLAQKEEELACLKKENEALRRAVAQALTHLEQGADILRAVMQPHQ